jgi:hypothetical protein
MTFTRLKLDVKHFLANDNGLYMITADWVNSPQYGEKSVG